MLRRPELADDRRFRTNPLRVRNREALHEAIDIVFRECSPAEIFDRLESAQIAYSRMNSVAEFLDHPQLAERGCWRDVESPAGPLRALASPVRMDCVEPAMGPVPALGQHSDPILEELGFDRPTIQQWRRKGTI